MNFSSSVTVQVSDSTELFNAVSVYVPSSLAPGNIVDWSQYASELTQDKPVVFTVDVTNYQTIMSGDILLQWLPAFNQDTNTAIIIYLIVFDSTQAGAWLLEDRSISYSPLSKAFEKLWFISYFKMVFDPNMKGLPTEVVVPGTNTSANLVISNTTGGAITLPAGAYIYDNSGVQYTFSILSDVEIPDATETTAIPFTSVLVGPDAGLTAGAIQAANFVPALGAPLNTLTFTLSAVVQGVAETSSNVASAYFDLMLAMSQLCRNYGSLSYHLAQVNLTLTNTGYPVTTSVDPNICKVGSASIETELAFMTALTVDPVPGIPEPRSQYFWGAIKLIEAENTFLLVHSEDDSLLTIVLGAWFRQRNTSGTFIGNKLSMLRLSGPRVMPYGYPSWLNGAVNENHANGQDLLDDKQVAYLRTIADDTAQDCVISRAVGVASVPGMPLNALMISKFVDYTCRQESARFITSSGTLTSPVLTDELAYNSIQSIVMNTLGRFAGTNGRLYSVQNLFPAFAEAKVGLTALEAASAWKARYKDDLDSIVVTGGITAE